MGPHTRFEEGGHRVVATASSDDSDDIEGGNYTRAQSSTSSRGLGVEPRPGDTYMTQRKHCASLGTEKKTQRERECVCVCQGVNSNHA